MVNACPSKWNQWIALAEYWYNTTFHSSHGKTPFEVLYGHPPRHFGISADYHCKAEELDTWLTERAHMQELIRAQLLRAQQHMKHQADKNRTEGVAGGRLGVPQIAAAHTDLGGKKTLSKAQQPLLWAISHRAESGCCGI